MQILKWRKKHCVKTRKPSERDNKTKNEANVVEQQEFPGIDPGHSKLLGN